MIAGGLGLRAWRTGRAEDLCLGFRVWGFGFRVVGSDV